MDKSILDYVKLNVGIVPDDTSFDAVLINHINSVFGILKQLGYGETFFETNDKEDTWDDFFNHCGVDNIPMVKNYMASKVRLLFDPPNGSMLEALKDIVKEFEWRSNVEIELKNKED